MLINYLVASNKQQINCEVKESTRKLKKPATPQVLSGRRFV